MLTEEKIKQLKDMNLCDKVPSQGHQIMSYGYIIEVM